ncbi:MAG: nucleotidyltransferase domain-containing protein [Candidatus Woesearchaeota archaeon]|nr:nucleotidyltransferase domain-containing protein [Candidatus Woesearchaeota archaeon]
MVDKITNIKLMILKQYLSNYLAQYHVRQLAQLIKKSHVTLLPHLKTLEKDKVMVSKKAGKNKVYSLNMENVAVRNYIVVAELIETATFIEQVFVIKKIFSDIFELNLGGTLLVFGSYAKRAFTKDSDIDLLYIGNITESQIGEIRNIGKIYGKIINAKKSTIKNFEDAVRRKDPLIMEILKNHILLQNAELFVDILWRYYDEIKA